MTKNGAATAATGLQQKAVLQGSRSGFAPDRLKSRQEPALQERCDGIRQESKFAVRLFGAKPWEAVIEIKKKGSRAAPLFFLYPYAGVYVEDIGAGAHRKSGV
jgi:hypothetical protein